MKMKVDKNIQKNMGQTYTLMVNSFYNAITRQIKDSAKTIDEFVEQYAKEHDKEMDRENAKKVLMAVITLAYYQELDYKKLKHIEKVSQSNFMSKFDELENMKKELDEAGVTQEFKKYEGLIKSFMDNSFEKNEEFTSLRQNYLIQILKESITPEGLQCSLIGNAFFEALNLQYLSIFKDTSKQTLSRKLDFTQAAIYLNKTTNREVLTKEAQKIIDICLEISPAIEQFKDCEFDVTYSNNKNKERDIAIEQSKTIPTTLGLNQLFIISKMYVNKHRHLFRDFFIGLDNTKTWQDVSDIIRFKAFELLKNEVDQFEDDNQKIDYLEKAKLMPVFRDHSHNYFFTGAFGRTATVKKIDKMIDDFKNHLKLHPIPEVF